MEIGEYIQRNEVGDAKLFQELFKEDYCFDPSTHTWYRWEKHYWVEVEGSGMLDAIDLVVKVYTAERDSKVGDWWKKEIDKRINSLNTLRRRTSVLRLAEALYSRDLGTIHWGSIPWKLPCVNGVVDLKTGELDHGKQGDYQRSYCPTKFVGLKAPCRRWGEFLLEIMGGNEEMVRYIQRLVGYAMSGTAGEGVFPVLWGKGRNGKGTMLEVLGKVLGDFATSVSSSLLMAQTYSRNSAAPSPDLMKLQGKRLVWANETGEGQKLSTAVVKWLVGGDSIVARPPYGREEITFRPTHTLFLLTNHKPQVDAGDYAIWQRIHLIPFTQSFVDNPIQLNEHHRDVDLIRRFTKVEDQGILAWAIRGCLDWQDMGLFPPVAVKATTVEYAEEEDTIQSFLKECCVISNNDLWVRAVDLYQVYRTWTLRRGLSCGNMVKFGRDLAGQVKKRRVSRGVEYCLFLRPGWDM